MMMMMMMMMMMIFGIKLNRDEACDMLLNIMHIPPTLLPTHLTPILLPPHLTMGNLQYQAYSKPHSTLLPSFLSLSTLCSNEPIFMLELHATAAAASITEPSASTDGAAKWSRSNSRSCEAITLGNWRCSRVQPNIGKYQFSSWNGKAHHNWSISKRCARPNLILQASALQSPFILSLFESH